MSDRIDIVPASSAGLHDTSSPVALSATMISECSMPPREGDPDVVLVTLHAAAKGSPRKKAEHFEKLQASLAATGGPLTRLQLNAKHEVYDGRNRLKCMERIGQATRHADGWLVHKKWCEVHDITDAQAHMRAMTLNMEVRETQASQKAMLAADTIIAMRACGKEITIEEVVGAHGEKIRRNTYNALNLRRADSELADLVLEGRLTINAAVGLSKVQVAERDEVVALYRAGEEKRAKAKLKEIAATRKSARRDEVSQIFDVLTAYSNLSSKSAKLTARVAAGEALADDIKRANHLKAALKIHVSDGEAAKRAQALNALIQALEALIGRDARKQASEVTGEMAATP